MRQSVLETTLTETRYMPPQGVAGVVVAAAAAVEIVTAVETIAGSVVASAVEIDQMGHIAVEMTDDQKPTEALIRSNEMSTRPVSTERRKIARISGTNLSDECRPRFRVHQKALPLHLLQGLSTLNTRKWIRKRLPHRQLVITIHAHSAGLIKLIQQFVLHLLRMALRQPPRAPIVRPQTALQEGTARAHFLLERRQNKHEHPLPGCDHHRLTTMSTTRETP